MKKHIVKRNVLYLHGLFANGETSCKASYLRSLNYQVAAPQLNNWWFSCSLKTAKEAYEKEKPDLVVGSSRGGAVALALEPNVPMVLLAPAWKRFYKKCKVKNPCVILHSTHDDLVPFSDSVELCEANPHINLIELDSDHRMNCHSGQIALKCVLAHLERTLQSANL